MQQTVHVPLGDRAYDVRIGPGLLSDAGTLIAPLLHRPRVAILTDDTVATSAISHARRGAARIIGIISTSGGIGKTEASMKDTAASAQSALGWSASDMVQS